MDLLELDFSAKDWTFLKTNIAEATNRFLLANYYNELECQHFFDEMAKLLQSNKDRERVYFYCYRKYKKYLISKNLYGIYVLLKRNSDCFSIGNCVDILQSLQSIKNYIHNDIKKGYRDVISFFNYCVTNNLVVDFN